MLSLRQTAEMRAVLSDRAVLPKMKHFVGSYWFRSDGVVDVVLVHGLLDQRHAHVKPAIVPAENLPPNPLKELLGAATPLQPPTRQPSSLYIRMQGDAHRRRE